VQSSSGPALSSVPTVPKPNEKNIDDEPDDVPDPPKKGGRPTLTRIK